MPPIGVRISVRGAMPPGRQQRARVARAWDGRRLGLVAGLDRRCRRACTTIRVHSIATALRSCEISSSAMPRSLQCRSIRSSTRRSRDQIEPGASARPPSAAPACAASASATIDAAAAAPRSSSSGIALPRSRASSPISPSSASTCLPSSLGHARRAAARRASCAPTSAADRGHRPHPASSTPIRLPRSSARSASSAGSGVSSKLTVPVASRRGGSKPEHGQRDAGSCRRRPRR